MNVEEYLSEIQAIDDKIALLQYEKESLKYECYHYHSKHKSVTMITKFF